MLRKIYNAIKAIGAFFKAVIDFVYFLIDSIVKFFQLIPKAVQYLLDCIGWLPVSLIALLTVVISILVIKKIIGR